MDEACVGATVEAFGADPGLTCATFFTEGCFFNGEGATFRQIEPV